MAIQCGDAFILGLGGHLWVVISEPVKHAGHFVIVNLTTDVFRAGTECELMPGDHQWIRAKCYVSFGDAREVTPRQGAQIVAHMATGAIIKQYPVTHAVLQKIIEAAKKSKAGKIQKLETETANATDKNVVFWRGPNFDPEYDGIPF